MKKPKEFAGFPAQLKRRVVWGTKPAVVKHGTDGDGFGCLVDWGGAKYVYEDVRLYGIDADELGDDDPVRAARARDAAAYLASLLPEGTPVALELMGMDPWKRIVCRVTALDSAGEEYDVGERLVQVGLAVPV